MAIYVRPLTADEESEIQKLAASKTKSAHQVQRAKIIFFSHQKITVPQIAAKVGLSTVSVRKWIRRFNKGGLSGLLDVPRTGRPPSYTQATRGKVIALARTKPASLGYPFTCWTIRRLKASLWQREQLNLAISVIWRWIAKEGLVWKKQQTWFNVPRDEEFVAGNIVSAYTTSIPGRRVICLDEMGPVSAKTYPAQLWKENDGLRAGFQPDYGRRGKTWVFGAFEPETGQAFTLCHDRRDSSGYIQLLEGVFEHFPAKEWVLIADNLSTHTSKDTQAALLAFDQEVQMLFIPKYCCWLNLIEPWWKQLRSLALSGRRFEDIQEVIFSILKATEYWNNHRHPYIWGKDKKPLAILNTSP